MAHIEEYRPGKWRATVKIGGRNGTRARRTFDHYFEAVGWAEDTEAAYRKGKASAAAPAPTASPVVTEPEPGTTPAAHPKAPSLHAYGMEWVERNSARLARETSEGYRRHLRGLAAAGIGMTPLDAITRATVQRWQAAALAEFTEGPWEGASTLNARLKVIRMVYLDAMAEGVVPPGFNPAAGVKDIPESARPKRILSEPERAALLAAAPDGYRLPILLGLEAGLRWQEVFGLPASAITGDYVDVWRVLEGRGATRRLRDYPKGHRARTVPFGTEELAEEIGRHAADAARLRGRDGLMFTSRAGTLVDYNNHRRAWAGIVDAAGIINPPGFHGLRHTYGSTLAAAGVPRSEIAVLMGHADEETTAIYIHAGEDGVRKDLVRAALAGRGRHLKAVG